MMGLTSHLKIYLCLQPCDMRKSYNGLVALADQLVAEGLKAGALFLFSSQPFPGALLRSHWNLYFEKTPRSGHLLLA